MGIKVCIVKEAIEAIDLLESFDWDILFLDHDLGGQVHVSSEDPNTGAEVARWIKNNPSRKPKLVIAHTLNPAGQKYIKSYISDCLIYPFAWTKFTSNVLLEPEAINWLRKQAFNQRIQ